MEVTEDLPTPPLPLTTPMTFFDVAQLMRLFSKIGLHFFSVRAVFSAAAAALIAIFAHFF